MAFLIQNQLPLSKLINMQSILTKDYPICSGHCCILVRFYPSGEAFGTASDDATVSDSNTVQIKYYTTVDLRQ